MSCMSECQQRAEEAIKSSGGGGVGCCKLADMTAGGVDCCKLADMTAGVQTQILLQSSKCSELLRCLS